MRLLHWDLPEGLRSSRTRCLSGRETPEPACAAARRVATDPGCSALPVLVSVSRVSCQVTESGRAVPGPRSGATLRVRAWVSALRGFGLGRAACHSCRRGLNRRVLCSHVAGRKGGGGGGVRESLQLPGQSWPFPLVVSAPEEEPELKPSLPFPPRLLVPGQNESPSRTCCAPWRGANLTCFRVAAGT